MPVTDHATSFPKEKINILLLENISGKAIDAFKEAGYPSVTALKGAVSEEELIERIEKVHILGIRSKTQVTEKVLKAAKKLQMVGAFCIGTNQINLKAALSRGVTVFNAPYSNTRSVAELVIGATIMLMRRIPDKNKMAHEGIWQKEATGSHELRGKTLGIIGYGNIGMQVSVLAEAFGMRVLYRDVAPKLPLGNSHPAESLDDLLSQADVVTVHVPETPATRNLINADTLAKFKKGAILINYARGTVIDLEALRDALKSGQLSGAAIDVFPEEPERNGDPFATPLQGLSNVLLTPHIGGSTQEAQEHIGGDVSTKLLHYLEWGNTDGSLTVPPVLLSPQENAHRILHIHRNVPGVLGEINSTLSEHNINIVGQYLRTNESIGYAVVDVDRRLSQKAFKLLKDVKETLKARMLY